MKNSSSLRKPAEILLICVIGIFIALAFKPNFAKLYELRAHQSILKKKLLLEEKRNYSLQKEYNGLSNDPEYIERVAREKLGWCRPTETVYRFQTKPPDNKTSNSSK